MKLLQEAQSLLTDPAMDEAKLTGIYDHLSGTNSELSKLNDALEDHLADDELEADYLSNCVRVRRTSHQHAFRGSLQYHCFWDARRVQRRLLPRIKNRQLLML